MVAATLCVNSKCCYSALQALLNAVNCEWMLHHTGAGLQCDDTRCGAKHCSIATFEVWLQPHFCNDKIRIHCAERAAECGHLRKAAFHKAARVNTLITGDVRHCTALQCCDELTGMKLHYKVMV